MNESWPEAVRRISKSVRIAATAALSMLALFLLVLTANALSNFGRPSQPATNIITVQGEGKATAVPDIATISFGATATASVVADAQKQITDKLSGALAAVKKEGVAEADIQTSGFSVSPHYEYHPCVPGAVCPNGGSTLSGYDVSEQFTVKIRDTSKVSAILGDLGTANVTNFNGPTFAVDDPTKVQDDARNQAIQKARARAEVLAKELGVHLGRVVNFSENNNYAVPMYGVGGGVSAKAADIAPAPPVQTGQNEYDESVTVTYEIW